MRPRMTSFRRTARGAAVFAAALIAAVWGALAAPPAAPAQEASAPVVAARDTAIPGLTHSVLPNGLELFVFENHTVPLAKIEITFRCGSITQTPQTAGLFHLYEHMLFKGNRVYRTQSDFQSAMKELGVASWNGGTSNEYVSYFFTVPSSKVAKGIEFWANAVRFPELEPSELEIEKQVVVNEIRGYFNDPDGIFESGMDDRLYAAYPWRRDVSGSEENIRNATVELLRRIQGSYYVPNNAALFVGGDVDPAAVQAAVSASFGSWPRAADPWASPPPSFGFPASDSRLLYEDDQMYRGVIYVSLLFRGPDVLADPTATYAADVWTNFMQDPNGRFRSDLFRRVSGIYNKDYINAYYITQRDGGYITVSTYLLRDPKRSSLERVRELRDAVASELGAMASDSSYFSDRDFDVLTTKLGDEKLIERETADRFMSALSFWWASASTDYYLGYIDNLKATTRADLARFIAQYLAGKSAVVGVRMNPADVSAEPVAAAAAGFEALTRDNAYWWERKE